MSLSVLVAATLPPEIRQQIAIEALAKSKPISHLAAEHQVSRKFVYQQGDKARMTLAEALALLHKRSYTLRGFRV